ncbi:hypothetical protein Tco_1120755 [Tanacetum coccineum]
MGLLGPSIALLGVGKSPSLESLGALASMMKPGKGVLRLRAEGSDVDMMKRSGGRTLLTQKLLGMLLLSRAEED